MLVTYYDLLSHFRVQLVQEGKGAERDPQDLQDCAVLMVLQGLQDHR
jgi:hypothetical protein